MKNNSFRFVDDALNEKLIMELELRKASFSLNHDRMICYAENDVDNIINSIRGSLFTKWQIIYFPHSWADLYRDYLTKKCISYFEELNDGELCFLVSGTYKPHSWKLNHA